MLIDCTAKRKLSSPEEMVSELTQAQQQLPQLADVARAGVPTTGRVVLQLAPLMDRPARPTAAVTSPVLPVRMLVRPTAALIEQSMLASMPVWPIAAFSGQSAAVTLVSVALTAPKALEVQKAMDREMGIVEGEGAVPPLKGTMGQPRRGLPVASQAPEALGPSKTHGGQKPPLAVSQLEIIDFPANISQQAEPVQMLFIKTVVFLAPLKRVSVVVVSTDSHITAQYNGIVATAAAKKGKHCEAPPIDDDSNYGESQLDKEEEEEKEGEMPTQHFQRIQQYKKIAKKKANKAKVAATLTHPAQNNFSGCISNALGVKVWGPLNVEQLNSCF
ncbi:hypothetical protein C0993_008387 [Termitomyces sp. T159_Od127]|nr:hypothetical protein C0993_008387 [Termitomyces sp. T159_Od127]